MNSLEDDDSVELNTTGNEVKTNGHVRVRKRIRVKKKKSPKKKLRKLFERLVWIIVIIAFIFTLVYLLSELDMTDKRYKKKASIDTFPVYSIALQKTNNT